MPHHGFSGAGWFSDHFQHAFLDVVGHGTQRQVVGFGAEGVFEFCAQGLDGEEGVGDEADDDRGHQADGIQQAKGQPEAVEIDAAVDDDGIGKGDGNGGKALAAAQRSVEIAQACLEDGDDGWRDVAGAKAFAEPFIAHEQGEGRFVACCLEAGAVCRGEEQVDVFGGVGLSQLVPEQVGEGADAHGERLRGVGSGIERECFTDQGTAVVHDLHP